MNIYLKFSKPIYKKSNINNLLYFKSLSYKFPTQSDDTMTYISYNEFLANNKAIKKNAYVDKIDDKLYSLQQKFIQKFPSLFQAQAKKEVAVQNGSSNEVVEMFKQRKENNKNESNKTNNSVNANEINTDTNNHISTNEVNKNAEIKQSDNVINTSVTLNENQINETNTSENLNEVQEESTIDTNCEDTITTKKQSFVTKISNMLKSFKNKIVNLYKKNEKVDSDGTILANTDDKSNTYEAQSTTPQSDSIDETYNKTKEFFDKLQQKYDYYDGQNAKRAKRIVCKKQSNSNKYCSYNDLIENESNNNSSIYFGSFKTKCIRKINSLFDYLENKLMEHNKEEEIDYNALYGKKESRLKDDKTL